MTMDALRAALLARRDELVQGATQLRADLQATMGALSEVERLVTILSAPAAEVAGGDEGSENR